MEKRIQPDFTNVIEYNIKFKNAILNNQNCDANSITSTGFYYNDSLLGNILCQLEDDGNGNMNVIYTNNENEKQVIDTVGTVNYKTGNIVIDNFLPTALVDDNLLSIYALPKYSDIFSTQNDFILLDNSDPNSIEIEYSTR
jgi:hypothetical protein